MKKRFFVATLFCFALSLMTFSSASAQKGEDADKLVGLWLPSNGKARVQIYKGAKTGRFFGRIVWLREPNDPETGEPRTDVNNPDEDKREKPLLGYVMLRGFEYDEEEGEWIDGTIYDPNNGSTYDCVIKMPNKNTIKVKGYIGTPLFGREDTWTRLKTKK